MNKWVYQKDATVVVAAHKPYRMPQDALYLPLLVGAANKDDIPGWARDDDGDNISSLNPSFCELTGLYWAWKHLDSRYIGLAHYRRHFSLKRRQKDPFDGALTLAELRPLLNRFRVFVPAKRKYYIESLYSHYAHTHYAGHLDEARNIICEKYPAYADTFDEIMKRRWGYMFNMMILEKPLFEAYCGWLFDILMTLRERIEEQDLSAFQGRLYGRVSEILFNVWLSQQLKEGSIKQDQIMELRLVHMEKTNWLKKGTAFLKAKFLKKKYEGSF